MGIDIRKTCNIFTITVEHYKVIQPGGIDRRIKALRVLSDFIWLFLTPNIGVIPNPKTGCIFPIFVSIFPMKIIKKKFLCLHFSIKTASLVPYRQLEQIRCLPRPNWRITNPTSFEIMQQFSDKKH